MDNPQPATGPVYAAPGPSGMFGTRVPAAVSFAIAILLFLLPLCEIKCSGRTLLQQSGIGFVFGKEWKMAGRAGNLLGDLPSMPGQVKKGNTQYFAAAAFVLGLIGLLIAALASPRGGGAGGILTGLSGAGCLVALMLEVKKGYDDWLAKEASDTAAKGAESIGIKGASDTVGTTLVFTPWFFVAILAFLAAALFCMIRMRSARQ